MTNFYFNQKDFNKLLSITSTLNDLVKANGTESFVVFDYEGASVHKYTHEKVENFLDEIFDKEPDSDWESAWDSERRFEDRALEKVY